MSRKLPFPVFDADNHMYEKMDAFTRHLPSEYEGLVKFVEIKGRTKIALNNTISEYIPNPTFQKVAPPGAQELQFRIENPSSKTEPGDIEVAPPPNYILAPDAFFEPEARVKLMDELSIDRAVMWPTLASLLEERMADDPRGTHVVIHALNQWMLEDWTFNFDERIYPTPVIAMNIVDEAIRELEFVVENGAKVILIRPAPVPDFNGRRRSFALEEFDLIDVKHADRCQLLEDLALWPDESNREGRVSLNHDLHRSRHRRFVDLPHESVHRPDMVPMPARLRAETHPLLHVRDRKRWGGHG